MEPDSLAGMTLPRRTLLATLPALPCAARAAGLVRVVVPLARAPDGFVPGVSDSLAARLIGTKLYAGLFRSTADGTLRPGAAQGCEVSDGGRRFVFRLRPGQAWHDGRPLTAEDVVFSVARFHAALSPRLRPVLAGLAEARVLDALTVSFGFAEPVPDFLRWTDALSLPLVPQHVHATASGPPDPAPRIPIGSGPFRFVGTARLVRFAGFAGQLPAIEELAFPVEADPAYRLQTLSGPDVALLAGDAIDWAALPGLRGAPRFAVTGEMPPAWARTVAALEVNPALPAAAAIRTALAGAADTAGLLRGAWSGLGQVAGPPERDLQAATAALNGAGLRPDDSGIRIRLSLLHPEGGAWPRAAAQLVTALRQAGMAVAPQAMAPEALATRRAAGDWQLAAVEQEMPPRDDQVALVQPAIPLVQDRRLHIPDGLFADWSGASVAE